MKKFIKKSICILFSVILLGSAFSVSSSAVSSIDSLENISVVQQAVKDNRILWGEQNLRGNWSGQDNFDFTNIYIDFFNSSNVFSVINSVTNSEYQMSDEYFNLLTNGMSNTVWSYMDDMRHSAWGGSCYGMSCVASLIKVGKLTPSKYTKNASVAHDLDIPAFNTDVKSLINFYQLLSGMPDIQNQTDSYYTSGANKTAMLKKLVTETQKVKSGGYPVVVSFYYLLNETDNYGNNTQAGHAIVSYDVSSGNYTFGKNSYKYKLSILDPNFSKPKYMYITSDFSEWCYEGLYEDGNVNKPLVFSRKNTEQKVITAVASSEELIDLINPETGANHTTVKNFTSNYAVDYACFANTTLVDETGAKIDGTKNNIAASSYIVPDKAMYKFLAKDSKKDIQCFAMLKKCYTFVIANNCKYFSVTPNGTVDFSANKANCEIILTLNNKVNNLDVFKFDISGTNINKYTVSPNANGLLISGNNLKSTIVTADSRAKQYEIEISTREDSVLLRNIDDDTIGAFVDKNDDGIYESEVSESVDLSQPAVLIFFNRIAIFFKKLFA